MNNKSIFMIVNFLTKSIKLNLKKINNDDKHLIININSNIDSIINEIEKLLKNSS